jgi:type II secretory ATPase GspE/PulE/Tfp pilus assembly ATPase PilB-like protein
MTECKSASPGELGLNGLPPEAAFRKVIDEATRLVVSDVYILSEERNVSICARHLGIVRCLARLDNSEGGHMIRYIKAEAGMDIAERRRPLDGRWVFKREQGSVVDLRVNSVPTLYGEDLAIRLLDRAVSLRNIDCLGMFQEQVNSLLSMLSSPGGLILVTGPTGAGKTTTLYACLQHLNNGKRKINTIEDPIEYAVAGVRQSQVNAAIHVDFADVLRAVLRQAADVIMIGEVRDLLTAETTVRAANSGHIVLTTLHSPTAAGAVHSMLGLGVPPYFLSTALLGVVSQRLVRKLCPKCKIGIDLTDAPQTFQEIQGRLEPGQGHAMYGPGRCDACRQEGYVGQAGLFEVLTPTKEIRRMITAASSAREIERCAMDHGMLPFHHAALLKVAQGEISIEEVFRAVPPEHLGLDE